MTHEESFKQYLDWLHAQWEGIKIYFPGEPEALQVAVFVKSLPPYDIWLAQSSPKASESPVDPPLTGDSPNLSVKAQEIRSKAREDIKHYMKTKEKRWPSEASLDLWKLAADWAAGQTVYKALDSIPDSELIDWNQKHEVFT
jgi:hypothetical protein